MSIKFMPKIDYEERLTNTERLVMNIMHDPQMQYPHTPNDLQHWTRLRPQELREAINSLLEKHLIIEVPNPHLSFISMSPKAYVKLGWEPRR